MRCTKRSSITITMELHFKSTILMSLTWSVSFVLFKPLPPYLQNKISVTENIKQCICFLLIFTPFHSSLHSEVLLAPFLASKKCDREKCRKTRNPPIFRLCFLYYKAPQEIWKGRFGTWVYCWANNIKENLLLMLA